MVFCHILNSQTTLSILKNSLTENNAFSKSLKKIDESENRFFYKESTNFSYIFKGTSQDLDGDNKSYMDIILSENGDTLISTVYTYQHSSSEFIMSETIHGEQHTRSTKYIKKKGDVYIAIEDIETPLNLNNPEFSIVNFSYILFNKEKGMYFHSFYYTEKYNCNIANEEWYYDFSIHDWRQTISPGICTEYINGKGVYRSSKKTELSPEELMLNYDDVEKIVIEAFN